MPNQTDGAYQIFYSIPGPTYIGTQASIEALIGVQEGAFAVGYTSTPSDGVFGFYDGSAWVWGSGGGGGGVESVTGDGVNNTDPANPVISYPTPGDIGAEPALGYTPEDVANKKTTMTGNESSNTFYLTAKAIYDWATGLFVQGNSVIIASTKTKITYDTKGLVTAGADAKAYQTYNGHGLNGTIAAGGTQYTPVGQWGLSSGNYGFVVNRAGKIKNLYQRINSTQPASGSLVVTAYVNGVASSLVLTIAANSVTGVYSETSTEVSVSAGNVIVVGIKNNASGASAFIGANSLDFEYSVV